MASESSKMQRRYGSSPITPDNPISADGEWMSEPQGELRDAQDRAKKASDDLHNLNLRRTLWGKKGGAAAVTDDELKGANETYNSALSHVGKVQKYIDKQGSK